MKTAVKLFMKSLILFALVLTSCTKEGPQGELGPIGPAGKDGVNGISGTNGADGEDGMDGEDGTDGNANVIASDWLEPTESSYIVNNPRLKSLELANGVNQNTIMEGVILVYYDNDIDVTLLPQYYFVTGTINKTVETRINHASRRIYVSIERFDSDLTPREYLWDPSGPAYGKGVRFRYVIIPSNTTTGKKATIDFKKMSYEAVMDHFELAY